MALAGTGVSMATGDKLTAAKAKAAAAWGFVVGLVAPGVTYLLTVDGNGISGTELVHAGLLSLAFAGGSAVGAGSIVYAVENKAKTATKVPELEEL